MAAPSHPCVVLVPSGAVVDRGFEDALDELNRRGYSVRRVRQAEPPPGFRDKMATDALAAGFTELLWLDPAVIFDPGDVERLRKLESPFVCGIYPGPGRQGLACEFLPETGAVRLGQGGVPLSVLSCGLAFALIRSEVFAAISKATPAGSPVSYFGTSDITATRATEDVALCTRARQCGFEITADTSIRLWRVGPVRYSWEDAGGERERYADFTLHIGSHTTNQSREPIRDRISTSPLPLPNDAGERPTPSNPRYLLVKAHVGFGDRLQCLSYAMRYAIKYGRTLCVDWRDSIWSADTAVDFHTYFDICGIPTISLSELLERPRRSVHPLAWANQLDRPADSKFIYKDEYACPLNDEDRPAELLVYSSVGHRTFHVSNLSLLRVKSEIRDLIVKQLQRYAAFRTVVHLRGTDRVSPAKHAEYVSAICKQMAEVNRLEPVLVVTDCLPLFTLFQRVFEAAVLRTPHLEGLDPSVGMHFRKDGDKHASNVELLIDFFLLTYAPLCFHDSDTNYSKMARFLRIGDFCSILGYDPMTT